MTILVVTKVPGTNAVARGIFDTWLEAITYLRQMSASEAETAVILQD